MRDKSGLLVVMSYESNLLVNKGRRLVARHTCSVFQLLGKNTLGFIWRIGLIINQYLKCRRIDYISIVDRCNTRINDTSVTLPTV